MMAQANPTMAMRPFLAADAPLLVEIFRASIAELTGDDYGPSQQQAWAAVADDEAAFAQRLSEWLTLIATLGGSPIGFIALREPDEIEMLYIHPATAGHGAGSMLTDAIEKLAAARGAKRLTADVSDSARDFFRKRGYVAQQRNTVLRGDEWLANTTMTKQLAPKESAP